MRQFTLEDQQFFSQLSGDINPVHLDNDYARRTLWGKPVVHGINQILWVLDEYITNKHDPLELESIEARFLKGVGLNMNIQLKFQVNDKKTIAKIYNHDGMIFTSISFTTRSSNQSQVNLPKSMERDELKTFTAKELLENGFEKSLKLFIDPQLLATHYKNLAKYFNLSQISCLLSTTRLVGNHCPGLNSIFEGLKLEFSNGSAKINDLKFNVKKVHPLLSSVQIECQSEMVSGLIKTFVRPEMTKQPTVQSLSGFVNKNEFSKQKALVIGGSRGVGEVLTKLLSIGGAKTLFTYNRGHEEAQNVVRELKNANFQVTTIHYNVLNSSEESLKKINEFNPTHIYYMPSPFIFDGDNEHFSTDLFNKFSQFYIHSFLELVKNIKSSEYKIFYPSSVAIDEKAKGMWEYSIAKYAGELLGEFIQKYNKAATFKSYRLPRMKTDQTASLVPTTQPDIHEVLYPLLQEFNLVL